MPYWLAVLAIVLTTLVVVIGLLVTQPEVRGKPGFWHLTRDRGVWWFTSPTGQREFLNTVTTIQPHQEALSGPGYASKDFDGNLDKWAKATAARVLDAGFKASGAWSNPSLSPHLPYARDLNLIKWATVDIDHPDWESQIEAAVKSQVPQLREDRNLIGYYLDNELGWKWDSKLAQHAEKYFEVTARLVRKYDPNHLILGVRFNHRVPINVLEASVGRVDAHSVNVYSDKGTLWKNNLGDIHRVTRCPIVISEFSFYCNDNQSGNANVKAWWAGQDSQALRAETYREFVLGAAHCSFIIGADWFQWSDEPPGGRSDGEDLNCGIVDIYDEPYLLMIKATREVRERVNDIHASGDDRQDTAIWMLDPVEVPKN